MYGLYKLVAIWGALGNDDFSLSSLSLVYGSYKYLPIFGAMDDNNFAVICYIG